jgi:uncharacterized repeat protein (TIGR01451 family)
VSTSTDLRRSKALFKADLLRMIAIAVTVIPLMLLIPVAGITDIVQRSLRAPNQDAAGHLRGTVLAHRSADEGVSFSGMDPAQEFTLLAESVTLTTTAVDVFLVVDLTGSFADELAVIKAQAPQIIAELTAANPNIRFGLSKFEDYPIPHFGSADAGDKAYERLVDLTFDTHLIVDTIAGLFTRDGVDPLESQLPALYQAATGAGQDLAGVGFPEASIPPGQQANFRADAIKLFLLWTEGAFHHPGDAGVIPYPGPSFTETVDAILALGSAQVIGITSGDNGMADLRQIAAATGALAPARGVDCDGDGVIDIVAGQPLACSIPFSGEDIDEAMKALIRAATAIPIADAGGPYQSSVGEPIGFDGSGSFDLDGSIVLYEWDFDNNGTVDFGATDPTATHTYPAVFSGTVVLRVTDNDGKMGIDTASVAVTVPTNLSLTKTTSDLVTTGQNLTYTLTVVNHGPADATGVTVVDTLPAGVTFVSAAASQGNCAEVSGVVTCNLGTLANGANATVTIVVAATLEGTIINTATVTSDATDPDPTNNSDDAQTTVQLPTATATNTPTATSTATAPPTSTPPPTFTAPATPISAVTPTFTPTSTPTATSTVTLEPTASATPTSTASPTSTPTAPPTSVGGGTNIRIYLPVIQN